MNGKRAKQLRKLVALVPAYQRSAKYRQIKRAVKCSPSIASTSHTPAVPDESTWIRLQKKFKGFRVSANRRQPQRFNKPHVLHPWHGWQEEHALMGMKSPKYRGYLAAIGKLRS